MATIQIPPFWRLHPHDDAPAPGGVPIALSAGGGWGSGAHETTQLCMQAIGVFAPKGTWRMLDFGSGTGILTVGAAKLGAVVDAVEIDEVAILTSLENAALNEVADQIHVRRSLEELDGRYEMVVANILRPTLLEYAEALTTRLAPGGTLVLSGLVATDLPEVSVRYGGFLAHRRPEVYKRGEWRALAWRG